MENTKTTRNSIQHTFEHLQHFQRSGSRKVCFSLQSKGNVLPRNTNVMA
jgi:hypothetical protein